MYEVNSETIDIFERVPYYLWDDNNLTRSALAVFAYIMDNRSDDGLCHKSNPEIAKALGYKHARSVQYPLKALEAAGYTTRDHRGPYRWIQLTEKALDVIERSNDERQIA